MMTKITEFEVDPGLEALQEAVQGPIEMIPGFHTYKGRACDAVCNEEGKLQEVVELNIQATLAWHSQVDTTDILVGDIAIVYGGIE